MLAVVQSGVY